MIPPHRSMTTTKPASRRLLALVLLLAGAAQAISAAPQPARRDVFLAPTAVAADADGSKVYVACEAAAEVLVVNGASGVVEARISVNPRTSGLAISPDGRRLYATGGGPSGSVCLIDTATRKVTARGSAGYQAQSPALSPDGATLCVCNRFDNEVCLLAADTLKEIRRIGVRREPFSAAFTPDGRKLLITNHLPLGPADADVVAACVTVADVGSARVDKEIALPNGATLVREVRVSPDGRLAVVVHTLARFHLPTTQVERGWINSNAASLIDLADLTRINTVLLDSIDAGAALPWGAAWNRDGGRFVVTHSGTHELSVIDAPALLAKLRAMPAARDPSKPVDYTAASRVADDVPNDLSFLVGLRTRIPLGGKGPRSVAVAGNRVWVANYFSDTLSVVDLDNPRAAPRIVPLGPPPEMTFARIGESHFNDATLCFQGWQACASCHSHDARVDGLDWDNLNDGIGNPKSTKSLLLAHATPPSMWLGVRTNAYVAVRAGIRNSLFTVQPPEVADAMDAYLKALKPMPSPGLIKGRLSASAERGRRLFADEAVGCADCHKGAHMTDMKFHDVGTVGRFDQPTDRFDTPSLIEAWRTGPYLHDGRATTIRDVLTTFNRSDKHGVTSRLTPAQIDDLAAYVLSL
jgi:YVTN family beta-propeller protein